MAYELIDEPAPSGRYELEPAAEKPGKLRRQLSTAVGVPLIGPTLAAFGVDVDPAGFAKGLPSGAADIGNTILNAMTKVNEKAAEYLPDSIVEDRWKKKGGLSGLVTGQPAQSEAGRANAEREASLKQFNEDNASPSFSAGRLAANIAGTAGTGGVIANTVRGVPRLAPLAESIASSGFRTGMAPTSFAGKVLDLGTRAAGGGITGAASAGLVNPSDAGSGALIGAFLPPALAGASALASGTAGAARSLLTPTIARDARSIVDAGGYKAADLPLVRQALTQQGPNIVQAPPTAPQILQNEGISQLQRTLRNAGDKSLFEAQQAQAVAREEALNRISPVTGTVQQSAENFGNALAPEVRAADEAARTRVESAFEGVDPNPVPDTAFLLPIDKMRAAREKFLGRGTFGKRAGADAAVKTAEDIGTEVLPAVQATAMPSARKQGEDLFSAMRSLGGIKQDAPGAKLFSGEINDLKQSGARAVIQNGRGQSPDVLAQAMHARGFIPDDDPATLFNAMREHAAGNKVFSVGSERGGAMRAGVERSMGDAPGAETIEKTVPWREVQNLRSSIGEAAEDARNMGRTREAAALDKMQREIDSAVDVVAAGGGREGERFPPDIVEQWRKALGMHQERMQKFRTGPQEGLFRANGPRGGELAGQFFSPRLSQAEDIAAFGRISSPQTLDLLRNYAVTDAAGQANAAGALTNAKFNRWLRTRSGAINGLFNEGERATLTGIGRDLKRADAAENLGRATGSNTAQNVQNALSLGLLDNPMVNGLASRTPIIGRFTGPMLDALRQSAKRGKVDRLGALLADPEQLARAIEAYQRSSVTRPLGLAGTTALTPLTYRAAPLLLSGQ